MRYTGQIHVFGDDVDTDAIVPGQFLAEGDPAKLAKACFLHERPGFHARVRPGDVLVAGRNFGCGSSREHAPIAIAATGIRCVVARSFSRIFFRSAVNIGLGVAEIAELPPMEDGMTCEVDLAAGSARFDASSWSLAPMPERVLQILAAGGLVPFMRARLAHTVGRA